MKTRASRDAAAARRAGRPSLTAGTAAGTAGWAQAQAERERIRSAMRAPAARKPPGTTATAAATATATTATTTATTAPTETTAATAPDRAQLLVDDSPGSAQMDKAAWLAELRAAIIAGASDELASTAWTAEGCPWIDYWLSYYEGRSAQDCEAALHRFAPATRQATRAHDYTDLVVARVRAAIRRWNKTGVIDAPFDAVPPDALAAFGPDALRASLGPGQPLDGDSASRMRGAFGGALPDVSIHTGPAAAAAVSREGARAVAVGNHIAFADGEYRPGTPHGDALLAHELSHVVQQSGGSTGSASASSAQSAPLERDADRATGGVLAALWGRLTGAAPSAAARTPGMRTGLRLQRCKETGERARYTGEDNPWGLRIISRDHPNTRTLAVGTRHTFITHRPTDDVRSVSPVGGRRHVHFIRFHIRKPNDDTETVKNPSSGAPPTYTLDQPGKWTVVAEVRPDRNGDAILLKDHFNVISAESHGEDLLKQSFGAKFDFERFRTGLAFEEMRFGGGVTKEQRAKVDGAPYITARGDNPAESKTAANLYFDVHPTPGAKQFQWYFSADDLVALGGKTDDPSGAVLPIVGIGNGRRWRTLGNDKEGFARADDKSATPSIGLSRSIPNIYWVMCDELDGNGKPLGTPTAVYKQAVLATDHWKQLEKLRAHIEKADKSIQSINETTEVALRAVLVARDGSITPLALFAGRSATDGDSVRLLDLTPNAPKSTYEVKSAPGAAASDDLLQKFVKDNEYPEGYVTMEIRDEARSLGMAPGLKTKEITHPKSFVSKFSTVSGWVSLGATVLGFLSLLTPFTAGASPFLFGVGAGAGVASAGASLIARFQEGRATPTGVAIDLLALAASLLQIKTLRMQGRITKSLAAQGRPAVEQNVRYLIYTQLAIEGAEAVFIAADTILQIDAILDNVDKSRSDKIDEIVRLLGQVALTGGLFIRSLKDLPAAPKSLPPAKRMRALGMSGEQYASDAAAQAELFEAAKRMRDQQNELVQRIHRDELKGRGTLTPSSLKRDNPDELRDAIVHKAKDRKAATIGEIDDIVRGRFDLETPDDVRTVIKGLERDPSFDRTQLPQSRENVPHGYPRYHVIMRDPQTGLTHEWQIGTKATTELFEREGIDVGKLVLPARMKKNIHDIEYDIFKKIQKDDLALAQQLGIPTYRKDLAEFSARTGLEPVTAAELDRNIQDLHKRASRILADLLAAKGEDYIKRYFKK